MSEKENRWWEFYFVRYLIGTITGALIISYLTLNNPFLKELIVSESASATWSEVLKTNYWIFILLGFAYCYISSAPILVFHTCRAYFKNKDGGLNDFTKWITTIIYLLIVVMLTISFMFSCVYFWLRWVLLLVIIITQSVLILQGVWQNKIITFYSKLTTDRKREKKSDDRDNYIESYKHLREHGNAFSILITEFALGFILIDLSEINHLIIVVSLWILPAMYVWLIGTSLEVGIVLKK